MEINLSNNRLYLVHTCIYLGDTRYTYTVVYTSIEILIDCLIDTSRNMAYLDLNI